MSRCRLCESLDLSVHDISTSAGQFGVQFRRTIRYLAGGVASPLAAGAATAASDASGDSDTPVFVKFVECLLVAVLKIVSMTLDVLDPLAGPVIVAACGFFAAIRNSMAVAASYSQTAAAAAEDRTPTPARGVCTWTDLQCHAHFTWAEVVADPVLSTAAAVALVWIVCRITLATRSVSERSLHVAFAAVHIALLVTLRLVWPATLPVAVVAVIWLLQCHLTKRYVWNPPPNVSDPLIAANPFERHLKYLTGQQPSLWWASFVHKVSDNTVWHHYLLLICIGLFVIRTHSQPISDLWTADGVDSIQTLAWYSVIPVWCVLEACAMLSTLLLGWTLIGWRRKANQSAGSTSTNPIRNDAVYGWIARPLLLRYLALAGMTLRYSEVAFSVRVAVDALVVVALVLSVATSVPQRDAVRRQTFLCLLMLAGAATVTAWRFSHRLGSTAFMRGTDYANANRFVASSATLLLLAAIWFRRALVVSTSRVTLLLNQIKKKDIAESE